MPSSCLALEAQPPSWEAAEYLLWKKGLVQGVAVNLPDPAAAAAAAAMMAGGSSRSRQNTAQQEQPGVQLCSRGSR
jgi:hypothetical protein